MRALVVLLVVAMAGCGGDPGSPAVIPPRADPLIGSWSLVTPHGCVSSKTFSADATFESDLVCTLSDGRISLQAELGTYAVVGTRINFYAVRATCPDTLKGIYYDFSMATPTQLSLIASDGVLAYQKVTPAGMGAFTFGCWNQTDGLFYPMPLATLP